MYRTGNLGNFIDDFDQFLGDIFLRFERFLLCGDINIHLDEDNPQSRAFSDTIASYGLYQLVTETTHKDGHLLDIVVATHKVVKNNIIRVNNQSQKDFPTCDHFPLLFELEYRASGGGGGGGLTQKCRTCMGWGGDVFGTQNTKVTCTLLYNKGGGVHILSRITKV